MIAHRDDDVLHGWSSDDRELQEEPGADVRRRRSEEQDDRNDTEAAEQRKPSTTTAYNRAVRLSNEEVASETTGVADSEMKNKRSTKRTVERRVNKLRRSIRPQ